MEAYIKSISDFKVTFHAPAVSWTLPVASTETDTGTVTFAHVLSRDNTGNWLIIDGRLWTITQIEPNTDEDITTVTLAPAIDAFDRTLVYSAAETTIGGFIAARLTDSFKTVSDTAYVLPYLEIINQDSTSFVAPIVGEETNFYTLSGYMRQVWAANNVVCDFTVVGASTLRVTIKAAQPQTHIVLFDSGRAQLTSQTYNKSVVAKVTVIQGATQTNYYLSTDGTVSTTVPASRALGEWVTISVGEGESAADAAQNVFNSNVNSHKIEFYSDVEYALYDKIKLRLLGAAAETTVTRVEVSSADRRYAYKCGELATTLTEKIKSFSGYLGSQSSQASAAKYEVGDIFTTTRSGDPSTLLGYGTWEQIKDRFLIAAGDDRAVGTTGGAETVVLKKANLPSEKYPVNLAQNAGGSSAARATVSVAWGWDGSTTIMAGDIGPLGSGEAINKMPPFMAVFYWLRIT